MKSWLGKMWAKAAAFALTLVLGGLTVLGGAGIGVLVSYGVFLDDGAYLRQTLYQEQCYDSLSTANDYLCAQLDSVGLLDRSYYFVNDEPYTTVEYDPEAAQQLLSELPRLFADAFSRELSSCQLVVSDPNTGETYLANFDLTEGDKPLYDTQELYVYHLSASTGLSTIQVAITATLLEKSGQAPSYSYLVCSWLLAHTGLAIFLTVLCGLLTLFCFCFSMASAGHWQNHEGIHLTWLDKIPADVWIIALPSAFFIGWDTFYSEWGQILFCAALIPVTLLFLCVFAAQCKAGTVIRGSLTARVLRLLWRILRGVTLWLWRIVTGIPLVWKTALVTAALAFLEFILYVSPSRDPLFLVVKVLEILAVLAIALNLRTLEKNGKQLSEGDLSTPVDTKRLFGAFRRYGQAMNRLQSGMESAVQEQMRAERMKTELITNVSHDIKTPLTSIVNYVDLLKKEDIPSPAAREYIIVLDQQSKRLKKLTEDLVEASKASSGALPVDLQPTDVSVLFSQITGEYQDRLADCHLTLVTQPPEGRGAGRQQAAQPGHGQSGVQHLQIRHAGDAGLCVRRHGRRADDHELQEYIPRGAEHLPRRADGALCAGGYLPPHGGQRTGAFHCAEPCASDGRHVPAVHRRRPVPGGCNAAAGAAKLTGRRMKRQIAAGCRFSAPCCCFFRRAMVG